MTVERKTHGSYTEAVIGDMTLTVIDANAPTDADKLSPHFHSVFELQFVKKGELAVRASGVTYSVQKGSFCLIPPSLIHTSSPDFPPSSRHVLLFYISEHKPCGSAFSEFGYYRSLYERVNEPLVFRDDYAAATVARMLTLSESQSDSHRQCVLIQSLFLAMSGKLSEIFGYSPEKSDVPALKSRDEELRALIGDYISINYRESGITSKVASRINMSERNALRLVHKLFGTSIGSLVLGQRMYCARQLILENELSLSEIAEKVGYGSYNAFYKAFVKYYGIAPEKSVK